MAFARRTGSFGGQANTGAKAVRLSYTLRYTGRNIGSELLPRHIESPSEGPFLTEYDLKELFPKLHALDQAIDADNDTVRSLRNHHGEGERRAGQLVYPLFHLRIS